MALRTKRKLTRLLLDLRRLWFRKSFSVPRAKRTAALLYSFITGKVFLFTAVAAVAAPISFGLLVPQVSTPESVNLEAQDADAVTVLVVSIDPRTCPACARLEPVVASLQSKGYNSVIEVGPHPRTRTFPTIYIFRGRRLVDTVTGFISEKTLKARIDAAQTP